MPSIDLSILNQRQTPAFFADTLANRPAPSYVGRIFISTDTLDLYRDTGSAWLLLSPSSTGTITGSGAAGQVTIFSGASSITGTNNLFWDTTNLRLGINTNTPGASLDVHSATSSIAQFNQTTATNNTLLVLQNSSTALWRVGNYYNAGANDFGIYDVVGAIQQFTIKKTTGQTLIGGGSGGSGKLVVESGASDNGIQIVGASAPSLRIDNANTGPTLRIGLGIATATNNFIQGSASGNMCVFNGSTTASPMLFGIYDAGAGNVQEAARISPARNWLLGTSTDSGQKLIVSGTSKITQSLIIGSVNSSDSNLYVESGNARIFNALRINKNGSFFAASSSRGILEVDGTSDAIVALTANNTTRSYLYYSASITQFVTDTNYQIAVGGSNTIYGFAATQNVYIGTGNTPTDTGQKLQVNGTSLFSGVSTFGSTIYAPERNIYLSYQTSAIRSVSSAGTQSLTLDMKSIFGDFNYSSNYTSLIVNTMVGASSIIINIWISASGTGSYNVVSTVGSTTITNVTFSGTASNPIVTITASAIVYWKATLIANAT